MKKSLHRETMRIKRAPISSEDMPDPQTKMQMITKFCVNLVSDDVYDLSARQLAIFLLVYNTDSTMTTREIGQLLSLHRSGMSRASGRLALLDLVKKDVDPRNKVNQVLARTKTGETLRKALKGYLG